MIDRRQAPRERRSAGRAPLTAAVANRADGRTRLAQSSNLGPMGMTLRYVGDEWPTDEPLALLFELPDRKALVGVKAQIVFDRADGAYRTAGVRFERVTAYDRWRIERFVAQAGPGALRPAPGPRS